VNVIHAWSSVLGLVLIVAAVVASLALEVIDERRSAAAGSVATGRRAWLSGRALRVALVVLVVAAVAATAVRLFAGMD
jgi:hypothetical protein